MAEIRIEPGSRLWHEWRRKCTVPEPGSFSALYFLISRVLRLEEPALIAPETHYAVCLFAESATGIEEIDSARVKMIAMPRGTAKSAIFTNARATQRLLQNPNWTIGIANETQNMANRFLGAIKQNFESNAVLQTLFPELIPNFRETTWREDEIVIKRPTPNPAPSVIAVGVGGTRTGIHLNEWILDDLISQDAAENALKGLFTEIESANRWLVRLPPMLKQPERDPISIVYTPWFVGDTYDFAERFFGGVPQGVDLEKHPKDFECGWTLKLPGGTYQQYTLYRRGDVAVFKRPALINGRSSFPQLWSTEELMKMSVRPEAADFFQANYMLEPAAGMATTFRLDWLKHYEIEGPSLRFVGDSGRPEFASRRELMTFISVDPAFSDRHTAARTAIPVTGTDGKRVFLLEDFAAHGLGVDDIASKVVDFVLRYPRTQKIFVETIVAQVAVADAIRRVAADRGVTLPQIEEIKSHGQKSKEFRIYGLESWFKRGLFFCHASHADFKREYSTFPKAQLRDILDALAFQRDAWERHAGAQGAGLGASEIAETEKRQLARIRAAMRR